METISYPGIMQPEDTAKIILDSNPKELMVAFDFENFLFTEYVLQEEMQAVMVVKSYQEKELYFYGYNSGYGGTGPSNTRDLLIELGMPYEMADNLKYNNGIRIHFTPDGEIDYDKIEKTLIFESRTIDVRSNNIFFDKEHMLANLLKKQLYFLELTKDTMRSLLKTIDLLQLDAFVYYIGKDNNRVRDFSIPYSPIKLQRVGKKTLDVSFVIIEGRPFDIVCFLGSDAPACIINNLYYFITGKFLFHENTSGLLRKLSKDNKSNPNKMTVKAKFLEILKYFREEKEIYEKIIFEEKEKKPWMR